MRQYKYSVLWFVLVHILRALAHSTPPGNPVQYLQRWVDPLPIIKVLKPSGHRDGKPWYKITMNLIYHKFHRDLKPTAMYGYDKRHPGPRIEATVNEPVYIDWVNELPYKHVLDYAIDIKINGNLPHVRNVVHLHGAHVLNTSDGGPTDWKTPGHTHHYYYPNKQDPAFLFYHDHALAITRLNFYSGLVGPYFLRSKKDKLLKLPDGEYEIPLIIQDKELYKDGSLFYPTTGTDIFPKWIPEFLGNLPVVNGKVYPYLEVEPRKYRFRILNGCNSRWLNLGFKAGGPQFIQIGSDGGFLEKPVNMKKLLISPAERADVLIDFSKFEGQTWTLRNTAPAPFPPVAPIPNIPLLDIMQFRVKKSKSHDTSVVPKHLPSSKLSPCINKIRDISLEEHFVIPGNFSSGTLGPKINNLPFEAPATEKPKLNTVELWRIVDATIFGHSMHIHQTMFKVLKRCAFNSQAWLSNNKKDFDRFLGNCSGPFKNEHGLKDTAKHYPETVTYLKVPFYDYAGTYVWHCHMLEHEDNDMMRPLEILPGSKKPEKCIDWIEDV